MVRLFHCYDAHGNREDLPNTYIGPVIRVDHDDVLLPLWQAFTDAVHDSPVTCLDLHISNIELSGVVLDMLHRALAEKEVRKLELRNVNFGRKGILFSAKTMDGNPTLELLHLGDNPINDLDATERLFSSIKMHPTLETVSLDGCNIGDECDSLLDIIMDGTDNIKYLSLRRNNIGPDGAKSIANILKKNTRIERIYLNQNKMKDEGTVQLTHALKTNTNLKSLHVTLNGATEAAENAMVKVALNTSSLNAMVDSNHTCQLYHDRINAPLLDFSNSLALFGFSNAKLIILCKLSFVLGTSGGEGLNVQYLNDVTLELMPNTLNLVQRAVFPERPPNMLLRVDEHKRKNCIALKNIFEVVRNCVVPLLFVP